MVSKDGNCDWERVHTRMSANAGAGMMAELMLAQPDSRSVCTGVTDSDTLALSGRRSVELRA